MRAAVVSGSDRAVRMQAYAKQAKDKQMEADAWEIRKRSEERLGELMEEQKETVGFSVGTRGSRIKGARVDERPTLTEAGIDKHLADRARKAFAMETDAFEELIARGRPHTESRTVRELVQLGFCLKRAHRDPRNVSWKARKAIRASAAARHRQPWLSRSQT
jgi:hypothetical protein